MLEQNRELRQRAGKRDQAGIWRRYFENIAKRDRAWYMC